MLKKISVIGGGEIGGAVSYIASGAGVSYSVLDKDPAKSSGLSPEECFSGTEAVFFCIPSWAVRSALNELSAKVPENVPLVFVSKGIEEGTNLTATEIAAEFMGKERIVFMGGPMIAEEIVAGKGGHAVLGGEKIFTSPIAEMFKGGNVSAETAEDAFSIAILGVLKNIYALLMGAAEGMGTGENIKAYLFARSLEEMDLVSRRLGGRVSAAGSAGIGDLLATGISRGSSNRKAGFDLASGTPPAKMSEGMASVSPIASRLDGGMTTPPLMSFVLSMVKVGSADKDSWSKILNG
jgi:glycerol-3-phosphate dehydrogenase (NAD(P)+)